MKFGQVTEYNMRNIFLKKSNTKCGGETIPRLFPKISKLSIYLDQISIRYSLTFLYCLFVFHTVCLPGQELSKYIGTKLETSCFYLI